MSARRAVDKRNGTSARDSAPLCDILVTYREFAPSPELRGHVRAYFSFTPGAATWRGCRAIAREVRFERGESFCSPMFADGQTSLVVDLGAACDFVAGWTFGTKVQAHVIGALRKVGTQVETAHPAMIGAYFEPGAASALLRVPAIELTDYVVNLEHLWGPHGTRLAEDLAELDEAARVEHLEAALTRQVRRTPSPQPRVDVAGLARWAHANPASMTVRRLADAAGMSRQYLTRLFRQEIGVGPKRYCRLARFHTGLVHAGAGTGVNWARVATELGYADQSHMIAEFRELSSLTPQALAVGRWFHPFILEARSRISKPHP